MSPRFDFLLALLCTLLVWPTTLLAAPPSQEQRIQATELRGELPTQYSKHFFGLTPLQRDGLVRLTLAYEPAGDRALRGLINFVVLSEDGLRRYLAGRDLNSVHLARGNVLPYGADNLMETSFQASGRGNYAVVVFNNLDARARYILTVDGGLLIDDSAQSVETFTEQPAQEDSAEPVAAAVPITAVRLTGALETENERHYIGLRPNVRDGRVVLRYFYDPQDEPSLRGRTNFYVLAEDGIRRIQHGEDPEVVNIATGYSLPFLASNELSADFETSGYGPYLAVIYNESAIPATYALEIDGGLLEEQVGQTEESQAAVTEYLALGLPLPSSALSGGSSNIASSSSELAQDAVDQPIAVLFPPTNNDTTAVGTLQLSGEQHHWTVEPLVTDGIVVLTLEYAPRNLAVHYDPVSFWVLDADGFRNVIAGARPQTVNIAAGSSVQYGADQGNLRAVLTTSGRGPYTIVVTKNVDDEMQYMLRVKGGRLLNPDEQLDVAQAES